MQISLLEEVMEHCFDMSLNSINPDICAVCRGRNWCSLTYCPLLARRLASIKIKSVINKSELYGSSPPSVFIGRHNYPFVNAGPSIPPETGDTSVYDYPERWVDLKLENIIDYRLSLITGSMRVYIRDLSNPIIEKIHEITLSIKPVDIEMYLEKPPVSRIDLSEFEPPQGPRAPLKNLRIVSNPSIPKFVERVYSDRDLSAREAVLLLYEYGLPVSVIQKILSAGAIGKYGFRKLVPTRWSITAVDSTISEVLLRRIREQSIIDKYELYVRKCFDNTFVAILVPSKWSFEWMEAWWPGSTWNPSEVNTIVEGDYEDYFGRTTYPDIGGCYYACRLAVAEYLVKRKKQALAIVLREIYPGFNIPLGVWFVRENVRRMFSEKPFLTVDNLNEVIDAINKVTKLGSLKWISKSRLLRRLMYQYSIDKFMENK